VAMGSEDAKIVAAYLQQKQEQWVATMRHQEGHPDQSDQECVRTYVRERSAKRLAQEFVADDAFLSHHICGFFTHAHDRDSLQEMIAMGAWVLNADVVGEGAPTVLAGLRWACKTRAGRKWIPTLTLGTAAFLASLLYLVTRKHLGTPPR